MGQLYDEIGKGYRDRRRPDPRIAAAIRRCLGDAKSVVNVGAGTGSYEPDELHVVGVDPSMMMLRQRPDFAAPAVCGSASELPFRDDAFDAGMAILTMHHWPDQRAGLRELRRVAGRRIVILTWDPKASGFWLTDYFPAILQIDRRIFPPLDFYRAELGSTGVIELPIAHDCTDGFLGAYWRRPCRYLDPSARSAISTFSKIPDTETGLAQLARDLDSGLWERRYGALRSETERDLGYRLVVAELA